MKATTNYSIPNIEATEKQKDVSPVKLILDKLKQDLATITELKYIDEDWGQLDYYSPNFPVQWPCALIDISGINYKNMGQNATKLPKNRQSAAMLLSITVANLKTGNTSFHAPDNQKQDASYIFDIIQEIHTLLQGSSAHPQSGSMTRQNTERIKRDDGVQEYNISYLFGITDI